MRKIIITEKNKQLFVEGEMTDGISMEISGDKTVDEVDVSGISQKEWEMFKKEKNPDVVLEEVEKIKNKLSK